MTTMVYHSVNTGIVSSVTIGPFPYPVRILNILGGYSATPTGGQLFIPATLRLDVLTADPVYLRGINIPVLAGSTVFVTVSAGGAGVISHITVVVEV
jgi:hypothetical protein